MKLLLLLLLVVSTTHGYHILCVFPVPSHSHNQLAWGIVKPLLKAGHTVTWVTPFPDKFTKNSPETLKIIDMSITVPFGAVDMTNPEYAKAGLSFVKTFSNNITNAVATSPNFIEAVTKTQYDAVITEYFFNDMMAGLAAVQRVPWILLCSTPLFPSLEAQIDEVRSLATVPLMFNDSPVPMKILNRAINAFIYSVMMFNEWMDYPTTINMYESLFGPLATARGFSLPPFKEAYHNVSVLLVNSHEALAPAMSLPPNAVNIAGFHIDDNPAPLPQDLKELLDKSPQGVVYFSMGSVLRSTAFPDHTRAALLRVFASLPYTIIWKFEKPLENLPPNVHVRPWLPQPSLLAHPNIRLFITHSGQLSTLEAIYAGVPLLAVPVFGDQPSNADRATRAGYAVRVDFHVDMVDELETAIKEMLSNDKYTKRVKYLSKIFRSRPVPPSKLISHYVELAIETKGAYHLRSLSLQYQWYERWMLDLVLILLTVIIIIVLVIKRLTRMCVRIIGGKSKINEKSSKKKKN